MAMTKEKFDLLVKQVENYAQQNPVSYKLYLKPPQP